MKLNFPTVLILACLGGFACSQKGIPSRGPNNTSDLTRDQFFNDDKMYYFLIEDWKGELNFNALEHQVESQEARLRIFEIDPNNETHCPTAESLTPAKFDTQKFSLGTRGNITKWAPKSSYKLEFSDKGSRFMSMSAINLTSMWNDVSQMREALSWKMFNLARIPSSRHGYARLCMGNNSQNITYKGLYSIIEDVDKSFLKLHFPNRSDGNLYKAGWFDEDLGPADLTYRKDQGYCKNPDPKKRTYRLKGSRNKKSEVVTSCEDLERFIGVINAWDVPEKETLFESPDYARQVREIFDVDSFLRWAAVNSLLGAWDNYWRTPANYLLYNSGGVNNDDSTPMEKPYFNWIPWDYDNVMGLTYWSIPWQRADIVDWADSTGPANNDGQKSKLPLIHNLLKNKEFLSYYLDFMEQTIAAYFNEEWIGRYLDQVWKNIKLSSIKEADHPTSPPHTHRRFTNDQVYHNGIGNHPLYFDATVYFWKGWNDYEAQQFNALSMGLLTFTRERKGEALKQIREYRNKFHLNPASNK